MRNMQSRSLAPLIPRQRISSISYAAIVAEIQKRYSSLRFCRNHAVVGILASVGFSFFTSGSSLFGLLFSGPKFVYYTWKLEKLKKLMKTRGIKKPKRRIVEFVAPLALGAIVGGFGLGVDGLARMGNPDVLSSPQDLSTTLSPAEFLSGVEGGAIEAVREFGTALATPPPEVFDAAISQTVEALNSTPLDTSDSEAVIDNMHQGSERLHELADSVQYGAVFNEQTPYEVGQGVTGAYLEEVASKKIEKTARLISKRSRSREFLRPSPPKSLVPVDVLQVLQEGPSASRRSLGPRSRSADRLFPSRTL
ncbi:hypothetical protein FRC01_007658 [Tulasnella sp. 417]|nr:hypothetical protein FRC01_007658 [Tulasnella sp. 417]